MTAGKDSQLNIWKFLEDKKPLEFFYEIGKE